MDWVIWVCWLVVTGCLIHALFRWRRLITIVQEQDELLTEVMSIVEMQGRIINRLTDGHDVLYATVERKEPQ